MPTLARTVNQLTRLTINKKVKHVNLSICQFVNLSKGFTLIELLVVISIFGLTASLITASYLTFERNQRLKSAAQMLKNDIRLAQNSALAGAKGDDGKCGASLTNYALVGWYVHVSSLSSINKNYTVSGNCQQIGVAQPYTNVPSNPFSVKTVPLPPGVEIASVTCSGSVDVNILFRPLSNGVLFHNAAFSPPGSAFLSTSGSLNNQLSCNKLNIQLKRLDDVTNTYTVSVLSSGEVNESKP